MIQFTFKPVEKPKLVFQILLQLSHGEDEFVTYETITVDNIHDLERYLAAMSIFFKYENQSRTTSNQDERMVNSIHGANVYLRYSQSQGMEAHQGWNNEEIKSDYFMIIATHIDYDRVFMDGNAFLKDVTVIFIDIDGVEQVFEYKLGEEI